MKKIIFIIAILISSNIYSQTTTIICGKIENSIKDSISIVIQGRFAEANSKTFKSKIDSKGKFKIVIPLNESQEANFISSKKNIQLFISPNDSIHCTYNDNAILETIHFEGNNSNQYNYFVKYYKEFGEPHGGFFRPDYDDVFKMNPVDFKKYRKEKVIKDLLFLKKYSANYSLSEEFNQYAELEINYSYYYALLSYHNFKKYFKKIDEKLPDDFYTDINSSLFKNDSYLKSSNYMDATKMYINELNVGAYTTPKLYFPKAIEISEKLISDKTLFNYQLNILSEMLDTDTPTKFKDSLVSDYLKKCPYNEYNSALTRNYKKYIIASNESLPKDALKSVFETLEGKEKFFSEVLNKNKNKVIYIDVWASWCGPCKIEMPSSIALKNKFKNDDVVFIYLSIDSKKELWEKAILNWGIKGEHYLIKNGLNSSFSKHFNIQGVPHYLLIDKDGKIIFPAGAKPSSKSIEVSIKELLK